MKIIDNSAPDAIIKNSLRLRHVRYGDEAVTSQLGQRRLAVWIQDTPPTRSRPLPDKQWGEDEPMGATERVAQFIVQTTFANTPPEAITVAKRAIVDCFGVAMAGSQTDIGRIVAR